MANETVLIPYQKIPTSGARGMSVTDIDGATYLAIPQLATDIEGTPADMNGGNSDTEVKIYKWVQGSFIPFQSIPSSGNEDAEFFTINKHHYLAIASIRSGTQPSYNLNTYSKIYEFDGQQFKLTEQFLGFAAKSWKHFKLENRDFLALAKGVLPPNKTIQADTSSTIYEYKNGSFIPFQSLPSKWAYDWEFFSIDNKNFLALTDHYGPSVLYQFNGQSFVPFQSFDNDGGRKFTFFTINNQHFLAYANINHASKIMKWDGKKFEDFQTLSGKGGRYFLFFKAHDKNYLLRINFIEGERDNPKTQLVSLLYQWKNGQFSVVQNIETSGGTQATYFTVDGNAFVGISNSLSENVRFATDSIIYRVK